MRYPAAQAARRALAALMWLTLASPALMADGPTREMQIAAGSAPQALMEFIRQTGLQVLFEFDAIRGYNTQAVSGELEASEALTRMLSGSGLSFRFVNARTVTVVPKRAQAPALEGRPGARREKLARNTS